MTIRLFKQEYAIQTAQLIAETLRISNSKDYSQKSIEDIISTYSAELDGEGVYRLEKFR